MLTAAEQADCPTGVAAPERLVAPAGPDPVSQFRHFYDRWFDPVCRFLVALGGVSGDVEDLAQEVFLVARRRFDGFDGRNPGGWLYRISERVAANARRRAWFRHLFRSRSAEQVLDDLPHASPGPAELLERKQDRAALHRILSTLSDKRKVVLVLSEIEGYTAEEIARLQGIPVATVRTRLFHARREFIERTARLRRGEEP